MGGQRPNPRTRVDSSRGESLSTLLRELNAIEGDFWIRLLYTHPAHWSDELIQTIAECRKVARYIDIPLQHISDHMLGLMQRETDGAYIRDLMQTHPRGHPGRRHPHHVHRRLPRRDRGRPSRNCSSSSSEASFERAGVFQYSQEEGTRAARWTATSTT